jgi:hypothetical protein
MIYNGERAKIYIENDWIIMKFEQKDRKACFHGGNVRMLTNSIKPNPCYSSKFIKVFI